MRPSFTLVFFLLGNEKLIEELIENGANCSKPIDVAGKTPIHISAQMGENIVIHKFI